MSKIQFPPDTTGTRMGITDVVEKTLNGALWAFCYKGDTFVDAWPMEQFATEILEKRAPAEMGSFCRVILGDDGLDSVTEPVAKTYSDDRGFADTAHPVEMFFRKTKEHSASRDLQEIDEAWDELIADCGWTPEEKVHADGIETERCGKQIWKWHWKNNKLVKSEVQDPDLPGGYLALDETGKEIAA
jgi:hypothetical protein